MRSEQAGERGRPRSDKRVLLTLASVALVALVLLLVLRTSFGSDAGGAGLSEEAYREVALGIDEEALSEALLPVRPVDVRTLGREDLRPSETEASTCVYYETAGGPADDLYRFCLEDDRLVEKTVVLPDDGRST